MPRNAAVVQKPGRVLVDDDQKPETPTEPSGVALAAETARVDGAPDPTAIAQPVMTDEGWVCPARPDQIVGPNDVQAP